MPDPLVEDLGLIKVHSVCAAMAAIWRPTTAHDLGIDGQIEFLIPGTSTSTGDIIAVQCKCGRSYFTHQDADFVYYYPEAKHRRYWNNLKLPVILVLHDPVTDMTVYAPVKPQLAAGHPIRVDKRDRLVPESRVALQSCCEPADFDPRTVLTKLHGIKLSRDGDKTITGIEFLLACTNREHSYFELRMCRVVTMLDIVSGTGGGSTGASDYDFILRSVFAILESQLAHDFREQFDEGWFELEVVPDIIVPLTSRGECVIKNLWANLDKYLSTEQYAHLGTLDANGIATTISAAAQEKSDRLDRSNRLGIEPR